MKFTEYELLQMISLIYAAQGIANDKGLKVEYVTLSQMKELIPLYEKYEGTETVGQIQSLTSIASRLYEELTKG